MNQASVSLYNITTITAITLCKSLPLLLDGLELSEETKSFSIQAFQTIGGALLVSAGQGAFSNQLLAKVPTYALQVSPSEVVTTSATALRATSSAANIPGILLAYMSGLRIAYAVSIAFAGICVLITLVVRIQRLDPEKTKKIAASGWFEAVTSQ